ncbi:hypothetical protein niasHT_019147 [Heterodera trifolii]|uniref:Uncharacterized protein n=1 Tax=Heterodera trifolii TaxID=157864 RepID=A0ABD2KWV9_9BILA
MNDKTDYYGSAASRPLTPLLAFSYGFKKNTGTQFYDIPMVGTQFYAISITGTQPTNIPIAGTQPTNIPIAGTQPTSIRVGVVFVRAFSYEHRFLTITFFFVNQIQQCCQSLGLNSPAFQPRDSTHQQITGTQHTSIPIAGLNFNHWDNSPAFHSLGLNPRAFQSPGLNFNHWDSILRHSNTGIQRTKIPIGTQFHQHSNRRDSNHQHSNYWDSIPRIPITGTQPTSIPIAGTKFQSLGQFSGIPFTGTQPTSIPIAGTKFQSLGLNSPAFQPRDSTHQQITGTQHTSIPIAGLNFNHWDNSPAFHSLGLNPRAFQSPGLNFNHWDSILRHSNTGIQRTKIPIGTQFHQHSNRRDSNHQHSNYWDSIPRHGGELVVEVLKAHGVRELFTLCGGHISPILVACITNTVTVLKSAQMAESPVLLLGGASPSLLKGRGALQTLVHSLCKFSAESSVSGTLCRPFEMPLPSRARPGPYLLSCQLTCTTWALRFRNFFSFSLIDIDSFVRHRLPVVALFGNDACCAQIARDQVPWFNSAVGCELSHANYDEVGTALGANGIRFEEPIDDAELRDRLWQALAQCQGRRRNSAVAEEKDGAAATTAPPTTMGPNRR